MTSREEAISLGIDPDDPKYFLDPHAAGWRPDDEMCPFCVRHAVRLPRLSCDIEQAKAQKLRDEGKEAACCPFCLKAHEGSYRSTCADCQARHDAEHRREMGRQKRRRSVYRDDGCGCVERIHPTELAVIERERGTFE